MTDRYFYKPRPAGSWTREHRDRLLRRHPFSYAHLVFNQADNPGGEFGQYENNILRSVKELEPEVYAAWKAAGAKRKDWTNIYDQVHRG